MDRDVLPFCACVVAVMAAGVMIWSYGILVTVLDHLKRMEKLRLSQYWKRKSGNDDERDTEL